MPSDLLQDQTLKNRYTIAEKMIHTDREVRTETAAHDETPHESSESKSRKLVNRSHNVMDLNMITIEDLRLNEEKLFTDEKPVRSHVMSRIEESRSRNKSL